MMNYKNSSFWVIAAAVIMVAMVSFGLIANHQNDEQDTPNNGDHKILKVGNENYFIYEIKGKYYVERPYQFVNEITEEVYNNALGFADSSMNDKTEASKDTRNLVEDNLAVIMSSSLQCSNPNDYIQEHREAYENILKYGGEDALNYILSEFQKCNIENDLRGQIMMRLCIELLGERNNVSGESMLPNEWFSQLTIRQKIELPNFMYDGDDPIMKLVYSTVIEKNKGIRGEFTIVAPYIFGSYEEGNKLKVFVTAFAKQYILYDKILYDKGGGHTLAAITYTKNADRDYMLEKYEGAGENAKKSEESIRGFCVMPVSGKKINGLANKMLNYDKYHYDTINRERKNLIEHLKRYKQYGVFLYKKNYKKPDELIPLTPNIIGIINTSGMPGAVPKWVNTKNIEEVGKNEIRGSLC